MRIAILQGHPDPSDARYGRALAQAYAGGAEEAGHDARTIDVASLDFPILRNILGFVGIGPIRETLIGMVETSGAAKREKWLEKLHALGRAGR